MFVGRLTCRITKEDLTEHFEQFGPVSEVFFDAGRKQYGFVTFEESVSAEKALMHKAHYLKVDKNKLFFEKQLIKTKTS